MSDLKNYLDTEIRKITIFLLGEYDSGVLDFDPVETKKSLSQFEHELILDFHGMIEYIQMCLDQYWFGKHIGLRVESVFKYYILMEFIQMKKYRNPGIDFDHSSFIVAHLEDLETKDIHCQLIGSSPTHPSNPNFFETFKSTINAFFGYH